MSKVKKAAHAIDTKINGFCYYLDGAKRSLPKRKFYHKNSPFFCNCFRQKIKYNTIDT